ncbi:MAG: radical SAM protein [Bacteriovorax sp.]|nr:radical SAM protein [Bacteriovorax sp.]
MFFSPPIDYETPVFRPPSEGESLLIQVTIGCSNNKCTYCDMYRSKKYRVRAISDILLDLKNLADYYRSTGRIPDKIFLCDGDALGAPMEILEETLVHINFLFPEIRRIGIYATAENILRKSEEQLKLLASKKLNIAYLGLESGDENVLHMIVKGNTASEMLEASLKIKNCGFKLSTIAMLGVGGQKYSKQHVLNTAKILGETSPQFFSFLTTFAVPGTPYHKMIERGLISPLTSKELLQEMHDIIELAEFKSNSIIFRANHVSNLYPLGGILPRDKETILKSIKSWIEQTPTGVYPKVPLQM